MNLFAWLFDCHHEKVTWPIKGIQCCLECGRERKYDLGRMAVGKWGESKRDRSLIFELVEEE